MSAWRRSCAPVLAAVMSLAFASDALCRGETWPNSDLDGHIGMVELYRQALTHGILWPYDRTSAAGMDALPYYSWPWELALAALAQALRILGLTDSSTWVCMGTMVAALMALPCCAGWCCEQALRRARAQSSAPAAADQADARRAGHAGAVAAWTFLATHAADGISGYGMDALSLGLLEQMVGWNLLLLLAGSMLRPQEAGPPWRTSLLLSALIVVHSLSALAGMLLLGVGATREFRRVLRIVIEGLLGGAVSLAVLWQVHGQIMRVPSWVELGGSDGVLAVLQAQYLGSGPAAVLPTAAEISALVLLAGALMAYRQQTPSRLLVVAALVMTLVCAVPSLRLLLPASCQGYRLQAPALLLALLAGACEVPRAWPYLQQRLRPWLVRLAMAVLWTALGYQQACSWSIDGAGQQPRVLAAELRGMVPAGSRLLIADDIGWHRWLVERWKFAAGWESLGCLHTVVAPPVLMAAAPAAQALGMGLCAVAPAPTPNVALATAILRDLGVTQLVRRRFRGGEPWTDRLGGSWQELPARNWQLWRLRDPAQLLHLLPSGLVAMECRWGFSRALLPAWAESASAGHALWPRLVLCPAREVPSALLAGRVSDAFGVESDARTLAVSLEGVPAPQSGALLRNDSSLTATWSALAAALAGVPNFLRGLQPADHPAAAEEGCRCRWRDEKRCVLEGLHAHQAYLLRYGYSSGMTSADGLILPEASGMTVVVPSGNSMTINCSRLTAGTVIAGAISAVMLLMQLRRAWRETRERARERARLGLGSHPRPPCHPGTP